MFTVKSQSGFTLFELLVSISIIGILLAIGTVSFTTAQQNGRDSRRRGDITGVRNALEQYYAVNSSYPASCDDPADLISVLPNGLPTDPKTGLGYELACDADTYCICATLERTGTGNANADDCSDYNDGDFFCAQSLQ